MKRLLLLLTAFVPFAASAAGLSVDGLRLWAAPDNTRVVLDITAPVKHSIFALHNPERLVIDLKGAKMATIINQPGDRTSLVSNIRYAMRNKQDLRVVLDLKSRVQPKSFLLKPNKSYGHRLVVDLVQTNKGKVAKVKSAPSRGKPKGQRNIIIAIDAGHGGEDPGAIGYRGTKEKLVVMQLAQKLQRLIKREQGMRPVMIRTGDYYIGLKKRIAKARNSRADLFVSLHADAFRDKRARGSSVYVLSPNKTSTSETAKLLAASENSSDLIGGVSLDDKDDLVKSVLLDLSQTATVVTSLEAGAEVLKELKRVGKVHKRKVEQAGFVVLKAPDMPSMLVETAFISNPTEEKNLRSSAHQQKMAKAIMRGIRTYFSKNPVPGTRMAASRYTVKRGDTLSGIAQQFSVSTNDLRSANAINGSMLAVGKTLRIPL